MFQESFKKWEPLFIDWQWISQKLPKSSGENAKLK